MPHKKREEEGEDDQNRRQKTRDREEKNIHMKQIRVHTHSERIIKMQVMGKFDVLSIFCTNFPINVILNMLLGLFHTPPCAIPLRRLLSHAWCIKKTISSGWW